MRKALVGCALLASACSNSVVAPAPVTVAETAPTAPELTSTVPVTTTTEAPLPATTVLLHEQATTTVVRRASPARNVSGACGGDLPPCYVMERESGGDPTVYNYSGSGASGKWQVMASTWNGYRGYANAADAPESVQDQFARELWAGGDGCSHWSAC